MEVLKIERKAIVFSKFQSTPNQVFVTKGLDRSETNDLTSIMKNDNDASCENRFWSKLQIILKKQ